MAQKDRTHLELTPEQKIARRVLGGERPPVDIEAIVRQYADIEYDLIPSRADAVLLYQSKKRARPLVILDKGRPKVRERFTLAHELGHIAIPWHVGEMAYHQDWSGRFGTDFHREMEAEANRFAAEILMPSHWIAELVAEGGSIEQLFRKVLTANVSGPAAALSLIRCLPQGYVFAQADRETGAVKMSGRSPGTIVVLPVEGRVVNRTTYPETYARHVKIEDRTNVFHWWQFLSNVEVAEPVQTLTSRELLEKIYADLGISGDKRAILDRRISGIVGSANSHLGSMPWQQRHAIFKQAFAGREAAVPVLRHPEFDGCLALRAREISQRTV